MTQPNQAAVRVRQSYLNLNDRERGAYLQAVMQMKNTGAPGKDPSIPASAATSKISVYDWYVQLHVQAMDHAVHGRPWFLPWHRQFILDFENALGLVGGYPDRLGLPYWDWAGDPPNARDKNSAVWAAGFMGGDGGLPSGADNAGDVTTGPFAAGQWKVTITDGDPPPTQNLRRGMGRDPVLRRGLDPAAATPGLPTQTEVDDVLNRPDYDSDPWSMDSPYATSFRNALEGYATPLAPPQPPAMHNRVHVWVGGSMNPSSSPNDPVFFLHHCNIDRIFAAWQDKHPGQRYAPQLALPRPLPRIGGDDPMWPWTDVTPNGVWDYKLGYLYDTLWPALPPAAGIPLTPVPVGPQWASDLFGPGWSLTKGTVDSSVQAVDAFVLTAPQSSFHVSEIIAQGPALALSPFAAGVGGAPVRGGGEMCPVYLCLRGPGAALQHPVLQRPGGGQQQFFQMWNGSQFVDNPSGKPGVVPVPKKDDCWFRVQPAPSSGGWQLVIQAGDTVAAFTAWAYLGPAAELQQVPR